MQKQQFNGETNNIIKIQSLKPNPKTIPTTIPNHKYLVNKYFPNVIDTKLPHFARAETYGKTIEILKNTSDNHWGS
jgi:hypothetical protein